MKVNNLLKLALFGTTVFAVSCTDLIVEEKDSKVVAAATGVYNTAAGLKATEALESAYGSFENYTDQQGTYALGQHTSAEMIPPTRGVDWGDNGVWRTLDQHTLDGTNSWLVNSWNDLNGAAYKCNEVVAAGAEKATAQQAAEAKFLRAFFQWHILDFWGKVPVRETTEGPSVNPKVLEGAVAFDAIVKDATEALADLPKAGPTSKNFVANKAAANYLLAVLYLNKHTYKGGAVDKADMAKVVGFVDAIKADGYSLDKNYFDNFKDAGGLSERILATGKGIGPQRRWNMTTHYNQSTEGWNGFATLSDFYNKFDAADPRIGITPKKDGTKHSSIGYGFLRGPQYKDDGSVLIDVRSGKPLSFTDDVVLSGCPTDKGIRAIKYHPVTSAGNIYSLMRFGAAQMMKIEALHRSGDAAGTLVAFNELRTARSAKTVASVDEKTIFDEWGRETYWEGHARTYEIRFGKYTTGTGVEKKDAFTTLFPIPSAAVVANPNLRQNTGY
jgi:starch-binding outer membrane protein, SusD/RagB family